MKSLFAMTLLLSAPLTGCAAGESSRTANDATSTSPDVRSRPTGGTSPTTDARRSTPDGWPFATLSPEEQRLQLERLDRDQGPIRTNWVPPGRTDRYGHAEGLIAAELDVVHARLVDYAHYMDLAGPKFKKVAVVEKSPLGTDLYFQLPIMKGVVTIWYVARFAEPRRVSDELEVIEGHFVRGNIKGMHMVFTLRPVANKTVLMCDLLLALSFPAPQGEIDQALRDACGDAVRSVRSHVAGVSP